MAGTYFAVRMPDAESYRIVKDILSYESVVREMRVGQAFAELIFEAIDIESYPEEVRERLREIASSATDDFTKGLLPAD